MRYALTVTVHVSDLYKSLPNRTKPDEVERQIKLLIKAEFERHGIQSLDKPGLYPVTPCHMRSEMIGAFPEITIKQGLVDAK